MLSVVKQKLYEVDFLREPAYSDKVESNTRLYFTLFLLLCAAGGFTGFFVYKATNRETLQQSLSAAVNKPIKYADYLKLYNKDLTSDINLQCSAKIGVYFYEMVYLDANNETLDATYDASLNKTYTGCDQGYPNAIYNFACSEGAFGAVSVMYDTKVSAGDFLEEEEVYLLFYDNAYDFAFQLYESQYSSWEIANLLITDMVGRGLLEVSDANAVYNYSLNLDDLVADEDFYAAAQNGSVSFFDLYDVNFEAYFEKANVTQCTYTELEGWLDVFNFALNSTQAFFGVFLFIMGLVYAIVKKIQHVRGGGEHNSTREGEGKEEIHMEVKEVEMDVKKEDKKEEKKEEKKEDKEQEGPEEDD